MFKIIHQSKISAARAGLIKTKNGEVKTPFFMPDATRAAVRHLEPADLAQAGTQMMVVNTFHLLLRPGEKIIKKNQGVHNFMGWPGPLISDSGGFQVFSLIHKNAKAGKIKDDLVEFKSPLDGSKKIMTPEDSIRFQFALGVDMMVCFDDCPPNDYDEEAIARSVERTIAWARRCQAEYRRQMKKMKIKEAERPLLFGVVQGGVNEDLRRSCARELAAIGFDGYGYGARPVDVGGNFLADVLQASIDTLPEQALRFGLGIGLPEDIWRCAKLGYDMFDCVIPTREGRHGRLFIRTKPLTAISDSKAKKNKFDFYKTENINNAKFAADSKPINPISRFPLLAKLSKSYLHHLFKANEPLGQRLATLNNLEFYNDLLAEIRQNINYGIF